MKKLIAGITAGLVLALPLSAEASTASIARDKVDHFYAGVAIDGIGAALCPKSTPFDMTTITVTGIVQSGKILRQRAWAG